MEPNEANNKRKCDNVLSITVTKELNYQPDVLFHPGPTRLFEIRGITVVKLFFVTDLIRKRTRQQ
jgi:hypothetical protein